MNRAGSRWYRQFRVSEIGTEVDGVRGVTFETQEECGLPDYLLGLHIEIKPAIDGDVVRAYSLTGAARVNKHKHYSIAVRRQKGQGPGSRVAKELLRRGHKVLGLARHTTNLVSKRKDMHMPQITYAMDPVHTAVHFSVRHMMVSNVRGEFTKISGTIKFDPDNPADSAVEATIDAASINTREPDRDTHLRSAEFLDVEKFPTLIFRSTKAERKPGGGTVTGDLTIHGVTRQIMLNVEGPTPEVKDPWGKLRIGFSATAKLSRKDYGLTWNTALESGGVLVGDEVRITIDVEAVRE